MAVKAIQVPCKWCKSGVGERCRDATGRAKRPCRERILDRNELNRIANRARMAEDVKAFEGYGPMTTIVMSPWKPLD